MNAAAAKSGEAPDNASEATVHATCVVLDEAGILIRGEAGSGKSTLALALIDRARRSGRHASLVGDDRIRITRSSGRLVARPHPVLAGLIEIRGLGILRVAQGLEATVLRLVIDLVRESPRGPGSSPDNCEILGIAQPRLALDRTSLGAGLAEILVEDRLAADRLGVARLTHPPILVWDGRPDV